jgi:glycosyltransferase involved in cell wall biosynthesis
MAPRILYVVTEDWYFLSHRLPMARAAKAAGYEVHVATRIKDGRARIEEEGFTSHALSWSRGSLSPVGSFSATRELRRLFRTVQPDIVHNVALKPVLLGTLASLGLSRIAVVNALTGLGSVFVDDDGSGAFTRRVVEFALKHLLKRARSCTVVQNPDDRRFLLDLGVPADAITIIAGSGIDLDRYQALPEPPPPVTAAFVGRMLRHKGVMTLVDAFRLVTDRGVKLRLLLAGDCDQENPGSLAPEQLREFASAFGIVWRGHVTDIREVWREAHFAVQPSRGGEGLPKSLLEAAACGRAMVATDVPGCREVAIEGETALTVPVDDAEALAAAMTRLAEDAALRARFGAAARRLVEQKFSADAIGQETVALYDRLRAR